MHVTSESFDADRPMPARLAFARPHPDTHVTLSDNRNPHLRWDDVPDGTRSFVLICVDPDAPTVPDDVNREGRTVPADLPRGDFHHWVMVDIPAEVREIAEGACSDGVVPGGRSDPPGPAGARQGSNDYGGWFAGDPDMAGDYRGYDGPGPPWNDERPHRYRFRVLATDLDRCPVEAPFGAAEVLAAVEGHVLTEAVITGVYTLNPAVSLP